MRACAFLFVGFATVGLTGKAEKPAPDSPTKVVQLFNVKDATIPGRFKSGSVLGPDRKPRWKKGGEAREFTSRRLWWSRHDPTFEELLDTRGKDDVESPLGEWTKVECTCEGKRITVQVNG